MYIICLLYCRMHPLFKKTLKDHIENFVENEVIWIYYNLIKCIPDTYMYERARSHTYE